MDTSHHTHRSPADHREQPCTRKNVGSIERGASIAIGAIALLSAFRRRGISGLLSGAAGSALLYRGISGHCDVYEKLGIDHSKSDTRNASELPEHGTKVVQAVTIHRPPNEVYAFWKDLRNLPKFMRRLSRVELLEDGKSHWIAISPVGRTVEWDARITFDKPGELIVWETLPGADLESKGSVRFDPAPGGQGTILKVSLFYRPLYGKLGVLIAKLLHQAPDQQLREDLRRLKQILEAGERPATKLTDTATATAPFLP